MKKTMITILTGSILLLCVGLSYSYFTGMITGEGKKLKVAATELRILFTDSSSLSNNEIEPGWKESKTFSVKNESDDSFNYNIVFENLVNTFVTEGFLQYKINSTNGYNMEGYLDIPKSSTPTDIVLAYDIDIPMDVTHEYTIEFVYHNSETVDQSEDMGKELKGNLAIVEGMVNPNIKYTVTMNSDNGIINPISNETVKKGNLEFEVTPDIGYDVNTMSVSCTPVANTVIVDNKIKVNDIRQDHNCEVSFDKELYTVDIVVNNGKSDALNKVVEYGESASAKITPSIGYTLDGASVSGNGCSIENDNLIISNVTSNGICEVTLPRAKYTVTLTGTGISTSDSPKTVEYEGSTSINFTLSDGYEIGSNVINCDNGIPNISGNVLIVSNVVDNTTCTLSPSLKSYEVTLNVNGGTGSSTKSIAHNGSGTYSISASTGYKLELDENISCTGNASGTFSNGVVTISNVTTTQTCTANLKKQTYSVSVGVNSSTMGSVSPASSTVNYRDNLTVTITPASGYKYSSNTCGLTVTNNQMTFSNVTSNINCSVTFTADNTLVATIKREYPNEGVRLDFSAHYSTTKMHVITDYDGNTTYYFTGNPNNWVSFAGKMWRIIRINGNGSVRLLYAGSGSTDGYIGNAQYYATSSGSYEHPAYVGWKYKYDATSTSVDTDRGNETESHAYKTVKNWYKTNITDVGLTNYIDTNAIYCNDRSISSNSYSTSNFFSYSAAGRLSNKTPSLECTASDRFAGGGIENNNSLPAGLMTADELMMAGGAYTASNEKAYYYLNKDGESSTGSNCWWTMTPYAYGWYKNSAVVANVLGVEGSTHPGYLIYKDVDSKCVIRPVISLKSSVLITGGDGSGSSPYTVTLP